MPRLLTACCRLLALAALVLAAPARAELQAPVFSIPVESGASATHAFGPRDTLRLALDSAEPGRLQASLASHGGAVGSGGQVEVEIGPQYVPATFPGAGDWRAPTFLVDFNDAPVPELVAALRAANPKPGRADVVAFAASHIEASHDRGFDVASQVARSRRGDCTEYAVLTAALARAVGLPARVVLGVALFSSGGDVGAYGHAWAEIEEDGRWQLADAALLRLAPSVRYLPLSVLDDEGPGFILAFMRVMPAWVRRVTILPPQG